MKATSETTCRVLRLLAMQILTNCQNEVLNDRQIILRIKLTVWNTLNTSGLAVQYGSSQPILSFLPTSEGQPDFRDSGIHSNVAALYIW